MGANYTKLYTDFFMFINSGIQAVIYITFIYYFIISVFGFIRKNEKSAHEYEPSKSFACIVAAHNEQKVIANVVDSLLQQHYPKQLFDIYVIADNCSDNTAQIAAEHGAIVCERANATQRGKGYALEWMFGRIFAMEKKI